jgi:hypothetical protein
MLQIFDAVNITDNREDEFELSFLYHIPKTSCISNPKTDGWLFSILRPAQEFFTYKYGDASKGLHNLGLCSPLRAFEQGGIFIVSHLL